MTAPGSESVLCPVEEVYVKGAGIGLVVGTILFGGKPIQYHVRLEDRSSRIVGVGNVYDPCNVVCGPWK